MASRVEVSAEEGVLASSDVKTGGFFYLQAVISESTQWIECNLQDSQNATISTLKVGVSCIDTFVSINEDKVVIVDIPVSVKVAHPLASSVQLRISETQVLAEITSRNEGLFIAELTFSETGEHVLYADCKDEEGALIETLSSLLLFARACK